MSEASVPIPSEPHWLLPSERMRLVCDRVAGVLADVRPNEGFGVLLLSFNSFVLVSVYYILKPVRDALILEGGAPENRSYAAGLQALVLLLLVPAYGKMAAAWLRTRLIATVTLFSVSNLALFALVDSAGFPIAFSYFLWLGVFNVVIMSQFWSFANDVYNEDQGKRLFAMIGLGGALGGWLGARFSGVLLPVAGVTGVLAAGAVMLLMSLLVLLWVHEERCVFCSDNRRIREQKIGGGDGFRLVISSRYLLCIAGLVFLVNLVNSNGEFVLGSFVASEAARLPATERQNYIAGFYSQYYFWANGLGLVLQLVVVAPLLKRFGPRLALFLLPAIALIGYASLLVFPILSVVQSVKTVENATDYSVQNTARQALFLITSRDVKYQAKAAVDTFFTRTGDVAQAALVAAGTLLSFGIRHFAMLNIVFAAAWLVVVYLIQQEHRRMTARTG